jgi:hypothetical protein
MQNICPGKALKFAPVTAALIACHPTVGTPTPCVDS